ncbi:MAG: ATP-dependent helicase [Bernardetiaceae bacterium]|nr:ATP-dependent helicase [Bernardetiaceae bacterium]
MHKAILSKEQEEIVLFNEGEGAVLVEAAAGSGKTRILTERVRYLLTEKKDKFFSVLCLTFTNKAAAEMNERLKDVPKLKARAFIGNFHEFCLSIVRSRYTDIGFATPPHIFDENDCKEILEEVLLSNPILKEIYDFPDAESPEIRRKQQREKLYHCIDFISTQKRNLIEQIPAFETDYKNWGEKTTLLFQDYNRRLREQNAIDYDDILLFAHQILSRPAVANIYRRSYRYILIDEAQDLSYAQYHIIKTICGEEHKNVLMVGDPKQSIYGFSGSNPDYMLKHFPHDFGAIKKEIKQNYRSSKAVLSLAEQVQSNGGIGANFFEGIGKIQNFDNEKDEAKFIISKIKQWVKKGYYEEIGKEISEPISFKNIAVLGRNRFVFSSLITLLEDDTELKTHFYLKRGLEKFEPESDFMKIFDLGTKVIVNPNNTLHLKQIEDILRVELSIGADSFERLMGLQQYNHFSIDLAPLLKYWQHLKNNPKSLGWVFEQLNNFLKNTDFQDRDVEAAQIAFDISELENLWSIFIRKENPDGLTLANFRYFLALNNAKDNQNEITIATVHATKGLEFEIVFLMGMNDGVFPDYRAKTDSALSEEKNNLYVAITRAKRALYITYPKVRKMPWGEEKTQVVSRFLKQQKTESKTNIY